MNYEQLKCLAPMQGEADMVRCLAAFPALEKAKTTPQDPHHHAEGDVWTHTCMVVRALTELGDFRKAPDTDKLVLFLAALLHDVAKADTTVIDPDGRIRQPGHSRRGAVDARVLLWRMGVPFTVREAVCRLIAVHQVPFFAIGSAGPARLAHTLSWALDTRLLATLAEADMLGRVCVDADTALLNIELFRELCREEGCYGTPRAYVNEHTRLEYARHGKGHPDYALHAEPGSAVTVMCGLPASGKDTWVASNRPGLPVVSFDDARKELGLRYGKNDGMAAHYAVDKAKALLREKAPFVWNATHISQSMRDKTLDLLYSYGAKVTLVYLEQSYDTLRQRNAKRDTSLTQAAIDRMLHHWEVPVPAEAHTMDYLSAAVQTVR